MPRAPETQTAYSCGDDDGNAWRICLVQRKRPARRPTLSAKTKPNGFGLYDMYGNVLGMGRGLLQKTIDADTAAAWSRR